MDNMDNNLILKMLPIDLGPLALCKAWPKADPVLNDMYLGLHKSVSTTRGNHTGLVKPGQLNQVKRYQPETKYTCKGSPNFILRQQIMSCYITVLVLSVQGLCHLAIASKKKKKYRLT